MSTSIQTGQAKVPEHFYARSDLWGLWNCLRLFGWPLLWIGLIPVFNDMSPWLAVLVILPLGITISKMTLLIHEAVHLNLFKTTLLNVWAGRLGGWYTLVEFAAFQQLHYRHHASVGKDHDPQGRDYGKLENASQRKLAWHLLRALLGWNVVHMLTLIRQRLKMQNKLATTIIEFCGLFVVQGLFFLIATRGGEHLWLGLIFPVAAATVGLFMSQLRGFCEHVPMPGEHAPMRLRSHVSNPVERLLIHCMNYNYHAEHHRFPRIPGRNLPALSAWLKAQGVRIEHSPSYLATFCARWRACSSMVQTPSINAINP
jgi:fatty acid desaturase